MKVAAISHLIRAHVCGMTHKDELYFEQTIKSSQFSNFAQVRLMIACDVADAIRR